MKIFLLKLKGGIFDIGFHLIGAIILNAITIYNKFPLIYSDCATYILSGFEDKMPIDKPMMFCLWVRHISLASSLWFIALAQGMILSYVIYHFVRVFTQSINSKWITILINIILVSFTGIGYYPGQIMPDVFSSIIIISLLLLVFYEKNKVITNIILSIIFFLGTSFHISNSVIVLGFLILFILGKLLYKKMPERFLKTRKLILIMFMGILGVLISPIVNYAYCGRFIYSKTSHVILMARMVENGILEKYFKDYPDEASKYDLYQYRNELPNNSGDFLWSPQSPLYKTGDWDKSEKQYNNLLTSIYSKPELFILNMVEVVKATFKQLFLVDAGCGINSYGSNTGPYYWIAYYFPYDMNDYVLSLQNFGLLDIGMIQEFNKRNFIFLLLSCISLLYIIFLQRKNRIKLSLFQKTSLYFIIIACFFNAFACGGISVPDNRYQNRIIWLLPLLLLSFLFSFDIRKQFKNMASNFFSISES